MPIKQSVCIPMIKPAAMALEEFVAKVAGIGFPAVEIWQRGDDFTSLVILAQKYHLTLSSMIGHDLVKGGLNDPACHERISADLRTSIDIAAQAGIPGLICFSGNRRPGLSEQEGIANTAAGLCLVSSYAEKKGVNLNLELLNSKVDHPGYQCDHTTWGRAVVDQVNSPRVKLLFDIYHMQIMEGDIIRTLRDNINVIGHFHTAGIPGRHEIDGTQELNYGAVAHAIADTPYDLYLGHEFSPLGDVFTSLREAFGTCNF